MLKKSSLLILVLLLTSCAPFGIAPTPFTFGSAIPTHTPNVVTATPVILAPVTNTPLANINTVTATAIIATNTATITETVTLVPPTNTAVQSVQVDILGCDTGIDILHGMGEVTNAYVTVKNTGEIDLPNTCSMLRAIDEGREHPDKKKCISNLPIQNQVTFKLTVDSTYKQDTIIQVDTTSNESLLFRADKQSCRDISLFGGAPTDLDMIKPIQ